MSINRKCKPSVSICHESMGQFVFELGDIEKYNVHTSEVIKELYDRGVLEDGCTSFKVTVKANKAVKVTTTRFMGKDDVANFFEVVGLHPDEAKQFITPIEDGGTHGTSQE